MKVDYKALANTEHGMSFRVGKQVYKEIAKAAKKENMSMSLFLRQDAMEKLERYNKGKPKKESK